MNRENAASGWAVIHPTTAFSSRMTTKSTVFPCGDRAVCSGAWILDRNRTGNVGDGWLLRDLDEIASRPHLLDVQILQQDFNVLLLSENRAAACETVEQNRRKERVVVEDAHGPAEQVLLWLSRLGPRREQKMQFEREGWILRQRSAGSCWRVSSSAVEGDSIETERDSKPWTLCLLGIGRLAQLECRAGELCLWAFFRQQPDNGFSNACNRTMSGHAGDTEIAAEAVKGNPGQDRPESPPTAAP